VIECGNMIDNNMKYSSDNFRTKINSFRLGKESRSSRRRYQCE
jgi:hypothetical protein